MYNTKKIEKCETKRFGGDFQNAKDTHKRRNTNIHLAVRMTVDILYGVNRVRIYK